MLLLAKLGAGGARRQRGWESEGGLLGHPVVMPQTRPKAAHPRMEPDNTAISGNNISIDANPFTAALFFWRK
jgi:hypothetical protein